MHAGIDFGTTSSSAAFVRDDRCVPLKLGAKSPSIDSVVYLDRNNRWLVGPQAMQRRHEEPERFCREFKRDLGSSNPYRILGQTFAVERLVAEVLRYIKGRLDRSLST